MDRQNKIPVTIVTGFLGAGKTTFINNILKSNPDLKFALVENEFGEVGIDSKLIKGVEASQMFELKNGCICCTISDEYEQALAELAEKFPDVDHLLIETTGIADPAPVIRPFFADEKLRGLYSFQGTVCIVDSINYKRYPTKKISWKQIATAEIVVISKAENLINEQKQAISEEIEKVNPFAKIEFAGVGVVNANSLNNTKRELRFVTIAEDVNNDHQNIQTKTIRFKNQIEIDAFKDWLSYNLDVYKEQIYRVKGILCFANEPYQYILQGVGGSFELEESDVLAESKESFIVVIGNLRNVDFSFSL